MDQGNEDLWPLSFEGPGRQGRLGRDGRPDREQRLHEHVRDLQDRGRKAPRRVRTLSRDEIVRTAIKVADAEGSEAISMRRIARELNAGTMSLYWHVASKEQLLDLMLDAVEGEQSPTALTGDWRADLRANAVDMRAVLHHHQWLMDFIGGRPPMGPNHLRNLESLMAAIDQVGLDTATGLNALATIATYVMGAVLRELRESLVDRRDEEQTGHLSEQERGEIFDSRVAQLRATGQFPRLVRMFDEAIDPDAAETRDARFEFGLECVLDGIAVRLPGSAGGAARAG